MYIDKDLEYSIAQAITTGTEVSTNVEDHGAAGNAYTNDLFLFLKVVAAFTDGTSLQVDFQTCEEPTYASPTVLLSTGVILEAALTENTIIFKARIPLGLLKYSRIVYTTVGTHSTGTIKAQLVSDVEYQQ